jgi:hypothetical protein
MANPSRSKSLPNRFRRGSSLSYKNLKSVGGTQPDSGVDLYWLPLGASGHFVRLNGRVFEAVVSRLEHRPACDLYHSALEVRVPEGRFVIEQTPVPDGH